MSKELAIKKISEENHDLKSRLKIALMILDDIDTAGYVFRPMQDSYFQFVNRKVQSAHCLREGILDE